MAETAALPACAARVRPVWAALDRRRRDPVRPDDRRTHLLASGQRLSERRAVHALLVVADRGTSPTDRKRDPGNKAHRVTELRLSVPDELVEVIAGAVASKLDGARAVESTSPWMTALEASEYLRCSLSRIRKLTMLGELPAHREGGRVLYRRDELDRFVAHGGASTGR